MNNVAVIPETTPDSKIQLTQDQCVAPSSVLFYKGSFVICDPFTHRIIWLDTKGKVIRTIGSMGAGADQLHYPTSLCLDDEEMLWVTDRWNHRIKRIDEAGKTLACIGKYGDNPGQFSEPWGIGFGDGHILVTDRNNHRVQSFSKDGTYQGTFGCSGPDQKYFESTEFKKGFAYTTWYAQSNRFATVETFFHKDHYVIGSMEYPCGLSIASNGDILLVDTGNDRIRQFNSNGDLQRTLIPDELLSESDFLLDVHASASGNTFVSFELRDTILKLDSNYCVTGLLRAPDGRLSHCTTEGNRLYSLDSWNRTIYTFTIQD